MTVSELRQELKAFDQDMNVYVFDYEAGIYGIMDKVQLCTEEIGYDNQDYTPPETFVGIS